MRRVVITGSGVLSPIGHDIEECAVSLKEMRGGIHPMPEWDHISDLHTRVGGKVTGIDLHAHFPRRRRRTQGLVGLFSMYATDQAIAQAGLTESILQSGRTGVAYGSTTGSSHELEAFCGPLFINKTMRGLDSSSYLKFMTHTCAANLAASYGIRGRVLPLISACTSGSQSIGAAYESILAGAQDVMLAGGAEEMHYATAVTFDLLMATSIRYNATPSVTPRPFDANRDGLVIGEGAGTLVLEELEHAKVRGAKILAELVGYGTNCDGIHITAPSEAGMRGAMQLALDAAKIKASDVDYVNMHGTATEIGDICESKATETVFGSETPCSTQKSYTGHTLGACGAMELVFSLLMMRDGFIAANRNLDTVDPRCGKLAYVRETMHANPRTIVSNNFAFGGVNTSLVIKRFEG
jgi:3-oxoacyl-[acyl-carrier-protein] synthase II